MATEEDKNKSIEDRDIAALDEQVVKLKKELVELRVKMRMRKEKNTNLVREKRKEIARILSQKRLLQNKV